MNISILNTSKKTKWLAAIIILCGTLTEDISVIVESGLNQFQGSCYRIRQQQKLKHEIRATIHQLKNMFVVESMDKRESFHPYIYADLLSPYALDSTFRAHSNPMWEDQDLADFTKLKWKIVQSKSDNLSLYYQDVLHLEVLKKLMHTIHSYDSGLCLERFISYQPPFENKIYFGAGFGCGSRGRMTLKMNGQEFETPSYGSPYSMPKSDTIDFELSYITINYDRLDTLIVNETFIKAGNRWQIQIAP